MHSEYNCPNCEYILDIYFRDDIVHVWTKKIYGETFHHKLAYHPRIYVSEDFTDPKINELQYLSNPTYPRDLKEIAKIVYSHPDVISVNFVKKYRSSHHDRLSMILEVELYSYSVFEQVIDDFKSRRINMYNIDINPRQHFFIDNNIRPMTAIHIYTKKRAMIRKYDESRYYNDYEIPADAVELLRITRHDNLDTLDYFIPPLKIIEIEVRSTQSTFTALTDRISSIKLTRSMYVDKKIDNQGSISIEGHEFKILRSFIDILRVEDPDFILVPNGDKFILNYMAHRARVNYIEFIIGRLDIPLYYYAKREGQSYMTYGSIVHRAPVVYIPGRVHIDLMNSFFFHDSGFEGLIELTRMSGIPLIRVSRASIGTVLTGVEMMINSMTIPSTLLPPNKARGEKFKNAEHLLISDNGGLIYNAKPGIYTKVWTIDYTSLYPFIMLNHNISSETVLCEHEECKIPISSINDFDLYYDSDRKKIANRCYQFDNIVPEVKYHICTRRIGVVTRTMSYILKKRIYLKRLKKDPNTPKELKIRFKRLDSAMKWILVSCFGYLGFKNARWGAIEAHQSVTAYARRYLLQAKLIANEFGYRLLGGITDSLFLQAKKAEFDNKEHIDRLVDIISTRTGIPMDLEGRFKWVVFANIKKYSNISALNRYYGYFDHGEFKLRGIRHRQRRVTNLEKIFQQKILDVFRDADTLDKFEKLIPQAEKILIDWQNILRDGKIDARDLVIKLKTGKGSGNYKSKNTLQAIVAELYNKNGKPVRAGENMYFIVRDDNAKGSARVTIGPEVNKNSEYDVRWYCKMLKDAFLEICETPQRQFFGKIIYDGNPKQSGLEEFGFDYSKIELEKKEIIDRLIINKKTIVKEKISLDAFF